MLKLENDFFVTSFSFIIVFLLFWIPFLPHRYCEEHVNLCKSKSTCQYNTYSYCHVLSTTIISLYLFRFLSSQLCNLQNSPTMVIVTFLFKILITLLYMKIVINVISKII